MTCSFLNTHLNILDYALGSLWRNRFKNGGIFIVFSLVIFVIASFRLTTGGLERAAENLLTTVPDIIVQKMIAGRQGVLHSEDITRVEKIFGITSVKPRVWGYYFDEFNGANYTVIGTADFDTKVPLLGVTVERDEEIALNKTASAAVIGQAVNKSKNLVGRSSFSLFRPDLSLKSFYRVGTLPERLGIVTDDLVVVELEAARDLFDMEADMVTDLVVLVGNPVEIDTIATKIAEIIPGSRVITKKQISKTYRAAFGWRSGFGIICLLGSVAAFIVLAWDKATGLSEEQRREVAILKAVGWQTGDVMAIRFWESAVISTCAFAAGLMLAWLHVFWLDAYLFKPVLLGWSVIRPSLNLVPELQTVELVLIASISILPYLAATVIPAWRSALVRPDSIV